MIVTSKRRDKCLWFALSPVCVSSYPRNFKLGQAECVQKMKALTNRPGSQLFLMWSLYSSGANKECECCRSIASEIVICIRAFAYFFFATADRAQLSGKKDHWPFPWQKREGGRLNMIKSQGQLTLPNVSRTLELKLTSIKVSQVHKMLRSTPFVTLKP